MWMAQGKMALMGMVLGGKDQDVVLPYDPAFFASLG